MSMCCIKLKVSVANINFPQFYNVTVTSAELLHEINSL